MCPCHPSAPATSMPACSWQVQGVWEGVWGQKAGLGTCGIEISKEMPEHRIGGSKCFLLALIPGLARGNAGQTNSKGNKLKRKHHGNTVFLNNNKKSKMQ